jgi:DNA-binding CsgD family transcriptional regulator
MLREALIKKGLSNREVEVAELVSKGLANKEVAEKLFVTEKTVKFHLTNIYKKMSIRSRAQLIVWCLPHLGFIENTVEPTPEPTQVANAGRPIANPFAAPRPVEQNETIAIPSGHSPVSGGVDVLPFDKKIV